MANGITRHIPNMVTCCNLLSGCIASVMAFQANYEAAILFIILGVLSLSDEVENEIAPLWHTEIQFIQSTHLDESTIPFLASIHEALHFFAQSPHFTHLSWSMTGFITEFSAKIERIVPTGQIVLQYVRPPRNARIAISTSEKRAIPNITYE